MRFVFALAAAVLFGLVHSEEIKEEALPRKFLYVLATQQNLSSTNNYTVTEIPSVSGKSVLVCLRACQDVQYESILADTNHYVFMLAIPQASFFQTKQEIAKFGGSLLFSEMGRDEWNDNVMAVISAPTIRSLELLTDTTIDRELLVYVPLSDVEAVTPEPAALTSVERDILDTIIAGLQPGVFMTRLRELSGEVPIVVDGVTRTTRTRNTYAQPHIWSANFCAAYFRALGYEVTLQPFRVGSTDTFNVIASKRGTANPNNVFVMGAHYDSTSQTASTVAPGAVDNGSGSAAVMISAAAFAPHSFRNTIHFVLFGGEEQGLVGSTHYVNAARTGGLNVVSALVMDMIAYSNRFYGVIIEGTRNAAISALMDQYETALRRWSPRLTIQKNYNSFGSDHVPFQRAGIPAFLAIEQDDTNYPHYHRSTDTVQYCNADQSVDIVKGLAALLYALVV